MWEADCVSASLSASSSHSGELDRKLLITYTPDSVPGSAVDVHFPSSIDSFVKEEEMYLLHTC